ncbi:hypothetical protein B5P41_30040, partial [Bacillus sp. SRB_28]
MVGTLGCGALPVVGSGGRASVGGCGGCGRHQAGMAPARVLEEKSGWAFLRLVGCGAVVLGGRRRAAGGGAIGGCGGAAAGRGGGGAGRAFFAGGLGVVDS